MVKFIVSFTFFFDDTFFAVNEHSFGRKYISSFPDLCDLFKMIFSSHICSIALLQIVNEQILRFTWLLHVIKRLFASRIKSLGPMVNWRVLLHLLCEFFMVRHLPIISVFQSMEFSEEVADEFYGAKRFITMFSLSRLPQI